MKIPGLDEITANMNKFADMLPVLESIDNNLRVLAEATIRAEFAGSERDRYLASLSGGKDEA